MKKWRRLERLERLFAPRNRGVEAYLRSLSDEELERALIEAAERGGATLGEWELERRRPRPVPVVAPPVASVESEEAGVAPGPPKPAEQSEELRVGRDELARVELDGAPVDPDSPRQEMVAAPRHTGPRVIHGHAINLEAVEDNQPEPRPEMVRAPESRSIGPDAS